MHLHVHEDLWITCVSKMKMERFIVAWLWEKLRVRGYLHKGVKDCEGVSDLKPVSLSALLFAELQLVKFVQKTYFCFRYTKFSEEHRNVTIKSSVFHMLNPIMTNGYMRVEGKLEETHGCFD